MPVARQRCESMNTEAKDESRFSRASVPIFENNREVPQTMLLRYSIIITAILQEFKSVKNSPFFASVTPVLAKVL